MTEQQRREALNELIRVSEELGLYEQQWREACAQWVGAITPDLYDDEGPIDWIRNALGWLATDPSRAVLQCQVLACVEGAGACVRAMRGDDTTLTDPALPQGVDGCLRQAMFHALWADDPNMEAQHDDLRLCESWLYAAWRQLQ